MGRFIGDRLWELVTYPTTFRSESRGGEGNLSCTSTLPGTLR